MKNEERGEREAENEERETGKRGNGEKRRGTGEGRREREERRTEHKERGPGTRDRTRGTGKWKWKKTVHQSSISKSSPILCFAPFFNFLFPVLSFSNTRPL